MEDKISIDIKDLNRLIDENNKYKQMWGEYKKEYGSIYWKDGFLCEAIEKLEQKYLPKSFKKTITFTIEAPTEHYLGTAINDFEMFWCDYNGIKGHCAKYYYGEK